MKEIEVKAKIKDIDSLKQKLISMGCVFGEPKIQEDVIFLPEGVSYPKIDMAPVARVRNSGGIITLTVKKRLINDNFLIKTEREVVVDNQQEAINIVKDMNFHEALKINKKRIACKYEDMAICIDEVAELGNFMEVEKMVQDDSVDDLAVQNTLFNFLQSLEIFADDRVTTGYDNLMYEKMAAKI